MKNWYCADFETTTDENDCRVWLWGVVNIFNTEEFEIGIDIISFLEFIDNKENSIFYFRNLKFDGEFIINYLLNNEFIWTDNRKLKEKEFTTLISDKGAFYSIKIHYNKNTVEIRDSLKIIPMSIADTAKAFGLDMSKGEIDYHMKRPIGYKPTNKEIDYIYRDICIDAKSLIYFFSKGLEKMTQGSDALFDLIQIFGGRKQFEKRFPLLSREEDTYIRKAYKGGYTYLNPLYKNKEVGEGYVLDNNSLYPSRGYLPLPYGKPVYFNGKYKNNKIYNLYVCHIKCGFKIKKNKLPTIQIKHTLSFQETEYLISSNLEIVDLYLTSIDYELFIEHYDVYCLEFIDGYMFKSMVHPELVEYFDKWGKEKIKAGEERNKGLRTLAKLMMNALIGKFGLKINMRSKIPYLKAGITKYKLSEEKEREGVYIPVVCFITAYGRKETIGKAQFVIDFSLEKYGINKYLYSDTDSVHTLLEYEDLFKIFEIDKFELGKWDIESHFTRAKFIRQKCYMETIEGKDKPTIAGLPSKMHDLVTYENFNEGTKYIRKEEECIKEGQGTKKRYKRVKGGVILIDTHFTIKG